MDDHRGAGEPGRAVRGLDVVWVYPDQFALDGAPRGFALRIDRFMGGADPEHFGPDGIWVIGRRFDRVQRDFTDPPLTLVIGRRQPLATPVPEHPQPEPATAPARLVVAGRAYARRH